MVYIVSRKKLISIVCPCYNEEDVLPIFMDKISQVMNECIYNYEIILINDGSNDGTLSIINKLKIIYPEIRLVNLSRNFGKEAALTAGLDLSIGDAIIPIDVDLQDPPELIHDFIVQWELGFDVVIAKRNNRLSDSFFKRVSAELFYKFHNSVSDIKIPENVGDYRLMSRRVVKAISLLPERQRFMKGIFSWVGFRTTVVEFKREKRKAGNTSFNGWKLWNFALDGITSFSSVPLRVWLYAGAFISFISFSYGTYIILRTFILGIDAPGYASMLTSILFLGGLQLIGLGVIGEYLGRLYIESKKRPIYIIDK